jgi:hypothetical protein
MQEMTLDVDDDIAVQQQAAHQLIIQYGSRAADVARPMSVSPPAARKFALARYYSRPGRIEQHRASSRICRTSCWRRPVQQPLRPDEVVLLDHDLLLSAMKSFAFYGKPLVDRI